MTGEPDRGDPASRLPRGRSGRIPQWVIDEALGLPTAPSPWRPSPPVELGTPPQRRPPHRRQRCGNNPTTPRWRRVLTVVGAGLMIAFTALQVYRIGLQYADPPPATRTAGAGPIARPVLLDRAGAWAAHPGRPTPATASDTRLGTPAPVPVASDAYRFVVGGHGSRPPIATYDPCRPIHVVVRPDAAPAGAGPLLTAALARVSQATGLQFVDDGTTTEESSDRRRAFQPDRYGDRWAPVLIAWTDPEHAPALAGTVVGVGGSATVSVAGRTPVYVSGQIELDAPQIAGILAHPGGDRRVQAIIQHELGHLVGLDHVDDPTQLMYAQAVDDVTDFAAGDLTGLSILGQGRCAPEL